uniref:Uncharacterized protein n=1 Tax=Romanomermis culicivorax TaxID=13658 RepID=A0A915KJN2_ROMCU
SRSVTFDVVVGSIDYISRTNFVVKEQKYDERTDVREHCPRRDSYGEQQQNTTAQEIVEMEE